LNDKRNKVKLILSRVLRLGINEITNEIQMSEKPEWDSLCHMEVIISLEEEFNVSFSLDEIVEMTSVTRIMEALKEKNCLED
jgi:acyl carrier protein